MYNNWEETLRDRRYRLQEKQNPSFSSSLLDKIYRSIDDGDTKGEDLRFRRETMARKQSWSRAVEEEKILSLRQECLLDKWMEKKAKVKSRSTSKLDHDYDHHHDALFFSSSSNSSDSSSGGLSSSSDTESIFVAKPSHSCFARPKWGLTGSEKNIRTERTLFCKKRPERPISDDFHFNAATDRPTPKLGNLKMYGNLKNLKQPISPGRRLVSFLNSIFTIAAGNGKKSKNPSSTGAYHHHHHPQSDYMSTQSVSKSAQPSTCSSASSFSRSCLSKHSPASREKLRNGAKRSVRFCPVSVILDEDLQPCGQKKLHEEERSNPIMSVTTPNPWRTRKSQSNDVELKFHAMEKSKRVEEAARVFLRKYHQNQNQNKNQRAVVDDYEDDNDDDDDDGAASCSSSDLFELDHLSVMGNEELPVYETTRIDRNRAIANGLIMHVV